MRTNTHQFDWLPTKSNVCDMSFLINIRLLIHLRSFNSSNIWLHRDLYSAPWPTHKTLSTTTEFMEQYCSLSCFAGCFLGWNLSVNSHPLHSRVCCFPFSVCILEYLWPIQVRGQSKYWYNLVLVVISYSKHSLICSINYSITYIYTCKSYSVL